MILSSIKKSPFLINLLDFILPPLCPGCADYNDSDNEYCHKCSGRIDRYEYPLCINCYQLVSGSDNCKSCGDDSFLLYALGQYQDPLKEIISQMKFKGIISTAEPLSKELADKFKKNIKKHEADFLLPIPLYPLRELSRGYNQSEIIADHLSVALEIPFSNEILVRKKKRMPQAKLDFEKRFTNIDSVFEVIEEAITPAKLILVDDVVTSGATIKEAKKVLEKSGYTVVASISLAHNM